MDRGQGIPIIYRGYDGEGKEVFENYVMAGSTFAVSAYLADYAAKYREVIRITVDIALHPHKGNSCGSWRARLKSARRRAYLKKYAGVERFRFAFTNFH